MIHALRAYGNYALLINPVGFVILGLDGLSGESWGQFLLWSALLGMSPTSLYELSSAAGRNTRPGSRQLYWTFQAAVALFFTTVALLTTLRATHSNFVLLGKGALCFLAANWAFGFYRQSVGPATHKVLMGFSPRFESLLKRHVLGTVAIFGFAAVLLFFPLPDSISFARIGIAALAVTAHAVYMPLFSVGVTYPASLWKGRRHFRRLVTAATALCFANGALMTFVALSVFAPLFSDDSAPVPATVQGAIALAAALWMAAISMLAARLSRLQYILYGVSLFFLIPAALLIAKFLPPWAGPGIVVMALLLTVYRFLVVTRRGQDFPQFSGAW